MKTPKEFCPHCGHSISPRWEHLNPGLVRCLILAIQAVHRKGRNRFHYEADLGLAHKSLANFQKLRYHALVAHADEAKERSGEWVITGRGGQFLRGEIAVPESVKVYRNRVIDHATKLVHIREFRGLPPEFNPAFAYEEPVSVKKAEEAGLFPKR